MPAVMLTTLGTRHTTVNRRDMVPDFIKVIVHFYLLEPHRINFICPQISRAQALPSHVKFDVFTVHTVPFRKSLKLEFLDGCIAFLQIVCIVE